MVDGGEKRQRAPSRTGTSRHAAVVAYLALFVALGGSAWAVQANSVGPKELKKNAVRAKHVKKNQVKAKHVAKDTIRTPKIKDGAVRPAKLAPQAIAARAYARVDSDGTIAGGAARNITNANITKPPNSGVYCFHDLPFDPDVALAVPRYSHRIAEYVHGGGLSCPAETQIRITLRNIDSTFLQDGGFAVAFF